MTSLTCRTTRLTILLGLTVLVGPCFTPVVQAAAPFARFQAPGFSRISIGEIEVTALSDGTTKLFASKVVDEPTEQTAAALTQAFEQEPLDLSDNAYLVNTGTRLVLVDTGGGGYLGPTLGKLRGNILAAGYKAEQIDDVLLTHMHRDHIGGLTADGAAAFPNAIIHANRIEADYWLSRGNRDTAPERMRPRFDGVVESLAPYIAVGRFKPFDAGGEVLPGILAVASYGHSRGHTSYVFETGGKRFWVIGDLINVAAVQFRSPDVSTTFDGDGANASASRNRIFAQIAADGALVGAAHVSFPGLGHIAKAGSGWAWVPVGFQSGSDRPASTP
jgi:glyoxylase-like metal-dependent hydrolase (beta-lactamase superfamily II)